MKAQIYQDAAGLRGFGAMEAKLLQRLAIERDPRRAVELANVLVAVKAARADYCRLMRIDP